MGETARERFERKQAERQQQAAAQAMLDVAESRPAPRSGRTLEQVQHARRKAALAERLAALGVPTQVNELPDGNADLSDMERFAAEQESKRPE
ncbi:hypothetical protein [Archangium violaceum]|uniref:hypothetical protein n=1 Tax=Archangium violaceum TaxID=83451 RepID=UPI0036D98A66